MVFYISSPFHVVSLTNETQSSSYVYWTPEVPNSGDNVTIFYNISASTVLPNDSIQLYLIWGMIGGGTEPGGGNGIWAFAPQNLTIEGNNISNVHHAIILLNPDLDPNYNKTLYCKVNSNRLTNVSYGVDLRETYYCEASSNYIEASIGISVGNSTFCSIRNNTITQPYNGINAWYTNHSNFINNTITNIDFDAIMLSSVYYSSLQSNYIGPSNDNGIHLIGNTSNNVIRDNSIGRCSTGGIHLMSDGVQNQIISNYFCTAPGAPIKGDGSEYLIKDNIVSGFLDLNLNDSMIIGNTFNNNYIAGTLRGFNNIVTLNSFLGDVNFQIPGTYKFDLNGLGNYWKQYQGSDDDNNGIGDTPFYFTEGVDNYPLMYSPENYMGQILLLTPTNGSSIKGNSDITITATNCGSQMILSWNGNESFTLEPGDTIIAPSTEGSHYLEVWANTTDGTPLYAYFEFVVDNTPPSILEFHYWTTATSISIYFNTSEPTIAKIRYGKDGNLTDIFVEDEYSTTHQFTLSELTLGEEWSFTIELEDQAGNILIDDNDSNYYTFIVSGILITLENPENNSVVSGTINIQLTVTGPNDIEKVLIKLPDIGWVVVNFDPILGLWIIAWDTTTVNDNTYYLEYRIEDDFGSVQTGVLVFTVQNNFSESSGNSNAPEPVLATTPGYTILFLLLFLSVISIYRGKKS